MKATESVYLLIRSLSQSEKRFFKLFSSLEGRDKNYIRLFDAIDKQKNYDEEKIKQRFSKEKFIRHLASEKNYLQKQILRSLRVYHSEATEEMHVRALNADAEILYNKWLLPMAEKAARKALAAAEATTRLAQASIALRCLDNVYTYKNVSDPNYKEWKNLLQRQRIIHQSILNVTDIRLMSTELVYLSKRYGNHFPLPVLQRIADMLEHPLITGRSVLSSRHEIIEQLHLRAYILYCLNRREEQAEVHLEALNYYESLLRKGRQVNMKNVISALSNFIKCRIETGHTAGLEKYFTKYDELRKDTPEDTRQLLSGIALRDRMKFLVAGSHVAKALELLESLPKDTLKKIRTEHLLHIRYYEAQARFDRGDFKASARILKELLESSRNISIDYYFNASRILLLMNYYEMCEYDLLHYTSLSVKRHIESKQPLSPAEKLLLNFFVKAGNNKDRKRMRALQISMEKLAGGRPLIQELDVQAWLNKRS